jgi:hypothetical protein
MPRQKNSNLPSKNSKTLKIYVSEEEFELIQKTAIDLGLGLSDTMKLSWCQFRKSREEKPQAQATKQSDRNEEIRKQAIELSQKDYLEVESLLLAEELVKHHNFICLSVREGNPALKIKKVWVLCSPHYKQTESEKQKNRKDLFHDDELQEELLEDFDMVKERY